MDNSLLTHDNASDRMPSMKNDILTTKEVAALLNVTTGRIRQIALSLGLTRKGRDWSFSKKEVSMLRAHTRNAGEEKSSNSENNS